MNCRQQGSLALYKPDPADAVVPAVWGSLPTGLKLRWPAKTKPNSYVHRNSIGRNWILHYRGRKSLCGYSFIEDHYR